MGRVKHLYEAHEYPEPIGPVVHSVEPNSSRYLDLAPLPNEEFRDIPGLKGEYQVSNYGRVKSLAREVPNRHGMRLVRERIIRLGIARGFIAFVFRSNGEQHSRSLRALVRDVFPETATH